MKKFLLVTFISLVTLSTTFAAYTFPGWDCRDVAKINQAISDVQADTSVKSANKAGVIVRLTVMKNIAEKNLTTFNAIKNETETVVNASNLKSEAKEAQIKSIIKSACVLSRNNKLIQEAAGYVKANKNYKQVYELQFYYRDSLVLNLGLTDDECYNYIITYFKQNSELKRVKPGQALLAVKKLIAVASKVSYTTQKEDLTYLNRIFTRKLIENKTQWEPAVVQIRTALETY